MKNKKDVNKKALIRYIALDRCFSNPYRKYTWEDLIEECNISKSQFHEDIKAMKSSSLFDAPIVRYDDFDNEKSYYRYSNLDFRIFKNPIDEHEAQLLKETLVTFSRLRGMPQFEWVQEIITRLEQESDLVNDDYIISFDENPYLTGIDYFSEIYNAIIYKKVLKITYKPFNKEKTIEHIHPYFLKQYNNRWFLFGLDNDNQEGVVNKPLDRIKSIEESSVEYIPNTETDFEEYFEDIVGVSVDSNKPIEKIILRVDKELLPYITTKPLHGSQIQHKDDPTKIELNLIPNYEFKALILSRGECIEVLEPAELREDMRQRAEKLYNRYK